MAKQWDARVTGMVKDRQGHKVSGEHEKRNITVFALTRSDAMDEIHKQAALWGLVDISIDHITRIGPK